jgi:hypothetical protein
MITGLSYGVINGDEKKSHLRLNNLPFCSCATGQAKIPKPWQFTKKIIFLQRQNLIFG